MILSILLISQVWLKGVLALDCLPVGQPQIGFEQLSDYLSPKCSMKNPQITNNSSLSSPIGSLERLSTRCAEEWEVKTELGTYKLPAGLQVLKLQSNKIIFQFQGKILEGLLQEEAFTGKKDCKQSEENPNLKAFLVEARFHLDQAIALTQNKNSSYANFLNELKKELDKKISSKEFRSLSNQWVEIISRSGDKVQDIEKYKKLIQKAFDPRNEQGKKLSESSLFVPLSTEWFNSSPELKDFFKKTWIESGYDIRILYGASGEGVSYYEGKSDEENESFLQMQSLLEKTASFIKQNPNSSFSKTPEASWLKHISKAGFKSYERMIFISPTSWKSNSKETPWAEFIPVDQTMGGLESDYLLSVMIHELNVNSPSFLATDTHGSQNETWAIRQCVVKNGINDLDQENPETVQRLFGINSQISTIYLKLMLD